MTLCLTSEGKNRARILWMRPGFRRIPAASQHSFRWPITPQRNPAFLAAFVKSENKWRYQYWRFWGRSRRHRASRCIGTMGLPTMAMALPSNLEVKLCGTCHLVSPWYWKEPGRAGNSPSGFNSH